MKYIQALINNDGDVSLAQYKKVIENFPDSEFASQSSIKIGEYLFARGLYSQASAQLKKSILEEIPIRMCIQERNDIWIPSNGLEGAFKEYFEVVEFCRSLLLSITNHLILEYGQDLKNEQWILEPFADLIISFSIIDIWFSKNECIINISS